MSEAFRFIAEQQHIAQLERMVAYVQANNPDYSRDEAEYIVVAAQYLQTNFPGIQHHNQPGWFTQKAREMGKTITNPDALQQHLDKRERVRHAPIERAYRELRAREYGERIKRDLGRDVQRAKTTDEKAVDLAKNVFNRVKNRGQTPAQPQQQAPQQPVNQTPIADDEDDVMTPAPVHRPSPQVADQGGDEGFDHSQDVIHRLRNLPAARPDGD